MMRSNATGRIRAITGIVLLLALLLIARLYHVQILRHTFYSDEGQRQYVHTTQNLFTRGSIFFTTKDNDLFSAATIKTGFLLSVNPSVLADRESTYSALNNIIPVNREEFMKRTDDPTRIYYEVATGLSREEGKKIEDLDMTGVSLYRDQWRDYPGDELAARTVGFVAYNGDDLAGRYGLERYYEDNIGRESDNMSVNFFAEIFGNIENVIFDSDEKGEGDIVTSIEPTVTRFLESELQEVQNARQSVLTGGIIMDPQTGDIYALSVLPSFNLNDRMGVTIEQFRNPLVESVYEVGSILKPLTVAAGIDSGAITPESTYYDAGFVELDGRTIRNYDGRGRGTVPIQEILSQSLNTGVTHIVLQMGTKRFREYFKNLKLGSETGIDLPNETYGLMQNLFDSPRRIESATASFGQGIATTPIGTTRALATLANGGVLVTPHIGQKILFTDGTEHDISFPEGDRVFSEETVESVTRMLVEVVDTALSGGVHKMEHYTIAAKTGTAQIANPAGGGYYDDRFLHSFFGYFPAYDPQFFVFLYTLEPKGVQYASGTLTDPFINITHFLINYYDIPPDR